MSYKSSHGSSVLTQLNRKHQKDIHSIKPCFKLEYARETFTQTKRSETEAQPGSKQPHTVSPRFFCHTNSDIGSLSTLVLSRQCHRPTICILISDLTNRYNQVQLWDSDMGSWSSLVLEEPQDTQPCTLRSAEHSAGTSYSFIIMIIITIKMLSKTNKTNNTLPQPQ